MSRPLARKPSRARQRALLAYLVELRTVLHVPSIWHIELYWEHPDRAGEGDVQAEIQTMGARHFASLRLGDGFWTEDPEGVRKVLVHELLHLAHADVFRLIDADEAEPILRQALGAIPFRMLSGAMNRELELMVDALTSVLEPFVPLPAPWPK